MKKSKKRKKDSVREYNPEKDGASLIIGGYSSCLQKKRVLAQGD